MDAGGDVILKGAVGYRVITVSLVLVLMLAYVVVSMAESTYIDNVLVELAYRDPRFALENSTLLSLIANAYYRINPPESFNLLYVRVYVLKLNGLDIVYAKYMGYDKFIDKPICYYAKLFLGNGVLLNMSYEEKVIGVDIDDPIVLNAVFTTQRSTETRYVIEAVVKSTLLQLNRTDTDFKWFSLGFAEIVNPEDKLLAVTYMVGDKIYGVIYDWANHKIVRMGLDIIHPPVNVPRPQKPAPTTLPLTVVAVPTPSSMAQTTSQPEAKPTTTVTVITNTTSRPYEEYSQITTTTSSVASSTPTTTLTTTTTTQPVYTAVKGSETTRETLWYTQRTETPSSIPVMVEEKYIDLYGVGLVALAVVVGSLSALLVVKRILLS